MSSISISEISQTVLSAQNEVVFAYLFGSQAFGRPTPYSDIDVAVYLNCTPDGEKRLEIIGNLVDALKSDDVDLVILNKAPLPLKFRIIKSGRLLVDKSPFVRHAFVAGTVSVYIDFERFERRILEKRFFNG